MFFPKIYNHNSNYKKNIQKLTNTIKRNGHVDTCVIQALGITGSRLV
jgi:hypothetical protein